MENNKKLDNQSNIILSAGAAIGLFVILFILIFLMDNMDKEDFKWIGVSSLFLAVVYLVKAYFNNIKYALTNDSSTINKINNKKDLIVDDLFLLIYLAEANSIFLYLVCMPDLTSLLHSNLSKEVCSSVIAMFISYAFVMIINLKFLYIGAKRKLEIEQEQEEKHRHKVIKRTSC